MGDRQPTWRSFSYWIATILSHHTVSRFPVVTALVLFLTARRYYKNRQANTRPGPRRRVVFIPKTLFTEDLLNVVGEADEDYELWYISREPLKRLANAYLPKGLTEYDYRSPDAEIARRKRDLRLHWERSLRLFRRLVRPAVFVTCAYYYREEREFAAACIANKIPFVALHKECITAPVTRVARQEVYGKSGPFTGSLITTYNEDEKRTIVAAGCADSDTVDVVGCPRMDHLFNVRRTAGNTGDAFDVVFFSFAKATYLPVFRRVPQWPRTVGGAAIEPWDWSDLYDRYHRFTISFARSHPDLRLALKVKTGFDVSGVLEAATGKDRRVPDNLTIIKKGEGGSLAASAKTVSGFNSTALLEAIAAKTPVVVPAFGEAQLGSVAERYGTLRLGKAVEYASSERELEELLEAKSRADCSRGTDYSDEEKQVLEKYVGYFDGMSGRRMRDSISRAVAGLGQVG